MALFHTTVLDNQIKALPTVSTASGSVATFDTDMTENLIEVNCQIVAQQSGSGTPSPSNPRPITTYTSLNLSHSGADTSNPTVYNIPFGQTVANGVLDITTGKLVINKNKVTVGTSGWSKYTEFFLKNFSDKQRTTMADEYPLVCSMLEYGGTIRSSSQMSDTHIYQFSTYDNIYIYDSSCADETAFYNKYSACEILYQLATPIEIQLDSTQITALLNENNIWCDTGDTSVKYILSVGKAIS